MPMTTLTFKKSKEADRFAVVIAEIGDGLEIRRQPAQQPDQLQIAVGFLLQAMGRLIRFRVAVDEHLQHERRKESGPSRRFRHGLETKP